MIGVSAKRGSLRRRRRILNPVLSGQHQVEDEEVWDDASSRSSRSMITAPWRYHWKPAHFRHPLTDAR